MSVLQKVRDKARIIIQSQTWVRRGSWLCHFLAVYLQSNRSYRRRLLWIFSADLCRAPRTHRVDADYIAPTVFFCGHWGLGASTGCFPHKLAADTDTPEPGLFSVSRGTMTAVLNSGSLRDRGHWGVHVNPPKQAWGQRGAVVLEC